MLGMTKNKIKAQAIESWLLHMAAGDTEALALLYEATKAALYGFVLSIIRNPHTAEDVLQETFIKAFLSAPLYRPMGKPMAWLLTIAKNQARMKLREKAGQALPLEPEHLPSASDDTERVLDRLTLQTALTMLGEEERQIVMLREVSGLKFKEIAALLELPLATALSKHRRALSKLKTRLKEEAR